MCQEYALVEHLTDLNNIIRQTFQSTNRIKFTCFDISKNFIVFGATSGGIYIFQRQPCQFLKLIPSKEGSASLLSISQDEKNVAIASCRGLLVVVEDCFSDSLLKYQVYNGHEGGIITAIKWNGNELFCGDNSGKVSVTNLMNFLTKAIFQTSSTNLMNLDSAIQQFDVFSKFLLVSTQTRAFLCDTEQEQYRQIGKKLRDGPFGACFFNKPKTEEIVDNHLKNCFKITEDHFSCTHDIKIYCARPGARLWEANFQGSVHFTHQFRTCLNQKQSDLIVLSEKDALEICSFNETISENFNFGQLFVIDRFILTFRKDGFYIFDPKVSALLFWLHLTDVKDVKIVDSYLYIWQNDVEIRVFSLFSIEELILNTLFKKQYCLCAELSVHFSKTVIKLLREKSRKIHLITIIKSKLHKRDLLEKVLPLIEEIEEFSKTKTKKVDILQEETKSIDDLTVLLKQYKLNKTYKNVQTTNVTSLLQTLDLNEIVDLLKDFVNYVKLELNEDCSYWVQDLYLRQVTKLDNLNENSLNFLKESFLNVNQTNYLCNCSFPLPCCKDFPPKSYEIGCKLMENRQNFGIFPKKVPFMYKFVLENSPELCLPLLIQFSDSQLIKESFAKFTYDIWDESLRLLLKLKSGICLNCPKKIDVNGVLSWKSFGILMVQSINATNTLKVFQRYSDFMKNELDSDFFQFCIFSSLVQNKEESLELCKSFLNDENCSFLFDGIIRKYLNMKYFNGDFKLELRKCFYCNLNIPVLDEMCKLTCGHVFHKICLVYNQNKCIKCAICL